MDDTQRTRLIESYRLRYHFKATLVKKKEDLMKGLYYLPAKPGGYIAPIVSFIDYYPNCYVWSIDNQQ